MNQDNPYRSYIGNEPNGLKQASPTKRVVWWLLYLYPIILWSAIFGSWAITYVAIGGRPGFGEHPDNFLLHTFVHALGYLAMFAFLGGPLLVPLAIASSFTQPFGGLFGDVGGVLLRFACVGGYLIMLLAFVVFWNLDPFGVVYWFMD